MKPSILITSALALILLVIAAFLFARAFSGVAAPGAMGGQPNQAAAAAAVRHGILPGILYVLGLLLAFVSWVLGLIQSIRLKRWIWLVFFILFSPITGIVYGLVGKTTPATPATQTTSVG